MQYSEVYVAVSCRRLVRAANAFQPDGDDTQDTVSGLNNPVIDYQISVKCSYKNKILQAVG